jgi:hypothetical protein
MKKSEQTAPNLTISKSAEQTPGEATQNQKPGITPEIKALKEEIQALKKQLETTPQSLEDKIKYFQEKQEKIKHFEQLQKSADTIISIGQLVQEEADANEFFTENYNFVLSKKSGYNEKELLKIQNPVIIGEILDFALGKINLKKEKLTLEIEA